VTVEAGGEQQVSWVQGDSSFASAGQPEAWIGLGDEPTVDRLTLQVPWRGEVVLEGPFPARRRLHWDPDPSTFPR
jgi:hypothetical protein